MAVAMEEQIVHVWRCKCGRVLGIVAAGRITIIHQHREIIIDGRVEQRCDKCGCVETWEK